jgi:hypothetical protein
LASRREPEGLSFVVEEWAPDASFPKRSADLGLSLHERRAHPGDLPPRRKERMVLPARMQAVSAAAQAGLTVSGFGQSALRQIGRTATEARVRSRQWVISLEG